MNPKSKGRILSIPVILPKPKDEKELIRFLKRLNLKKSDIKKIYYADSKALLILKKRVKFKPPKDLIPSREEEKKIVFVHEFVEEHEYLIEMERVAEVSQQIAEIKGFSGRERELFGRALLNMKGQREPKRLGLYFVKFGTSRLIETEISPGDVVLISKGEPLKSDLLGTVSQIGRHHISVAFENMPPKWVYSPGVRIDLYINDITFKRMSENLRQIRDDLSFSGIRDLALGLREPEPIRQKRSLISSKLNDAQNEAAAKAFCSKDLFLIHGPPGTGKTSTLIELIVELVKSGNKILATADSNTAVDNMLSRLAKRDLSLVRIGHPARILAELEEYTIHSKYEKSFEAANIKSGWEEVAMLVKKRDQFSKPTPARTRGMSHDRILTLAARGKNQRGLSVATIQSMANWIRYNKKIDSLVSALRSKEEEIYKKIISESDVVLATNSMVMSEVLKEFRFDVAVVDEGSQQIVPSTLIPIVRAKRFVIAGDHRQLPPTVVSKEAQKLKRSLFEDLIDRYPDHSGMLTIQYRMNEKIMEFSNREFYENRLVAHESVKNRLLSDLNPKEPLKFKDILDPSEPIVFVDTAGVEATESLPDRSTSYENKTEADLVVDLVEELVRMGIEPPDIGVISPYLSQVKRIKNGLSNSVPGCEVKSVDGFQGREKEVIIISFVRSNPEGEIGFLKDARRLNVALTRAKRKLICIGDSATLGSFDLYRRLLEYFSLQGKILTFKGDERENG